MRLAVQIDHPRISDLPFVLQIDSGLVDPLTEDGHQQVNRPHRRRMILTAETLRDAEDTIGARAQRTRLIRLRAS